MEGPNKVNWGDFLLFYSFFTLNQLRTLLNQLRTLERWGEGGWP
jgi:hypothetical protein